MFVMVRPKNGPYRGRHGEEVTMEKAKEDRGTGPGDSNHGSGAGHGHTPRLFRPRGGISVRCHFRLRGCGMFSGCECIGTGTVAARRKREAEKKGMKRARIRTNIAEKRQRVDKVIRSVVIVGARPDGHDQKGEAGCRPCGGLGRKGSSVFGGLL